jgi:indolepyruvate ferredoxin oxidoreductase beta subunit
MKFDIFLAGVGGQGIISLSVIIASSALKEGLYVKQSEVHGMSQRGGDISANLRISDQPIHSDLIPRAGADLIISMEPLEALRHLAYLSPQGALLTSTVPVKNFSLYPDAERLLDVIRALPRSYLVDAERLARDAGSGLASNMVMVGAAAHLLPVAAGSLESCIREVFGRKGEKVVKANLAAFRAGREAVEKLAS